MVNEKTYSRWVVRGAWLTTCSPRCCTSSFINTYGKKKVKYTNSNGYYDGFFFVVVVMLWQKVQFSKWQMHMHGTGCISILVSQTCRKVTSEYLHHCFIECSIYTAEFQKQNISLVTLEYGIIYVSPSLSPFITISKSSWTLELSVV